MNRMEYMTELTQRLHQLPLSQEDVDDALRFYEEYFDEAGPDQAQAVITELGSPTYVAAQIALKLSTSPTPLTERKPGFEHGAASSRPSALRPNMKSATKSATKSAAKSDAKSAAKSAAKSSLKRDASVLKMIILGILAAPVALPLAIAGVSVVFALTISAAAIVLAFGVGGIACLSAGAAVGIAAVAQLPSDFATGLYFIGVALFSVGAGGLLAKLGFWIGRCFIKLATKIGSRFFGERRRRLAKHADAGNAAGNVAGNVAGNDTGNIPVNDTVTVAGNDTGNDIRNDTRNDTRYDTGNSGSVSSIGAVRNGGME